jgi:hypothetical protein
MLEINLRITGVTPLILSRFHEEAAEAASSGSRSSASAQDRGTPREIAEKKLYLGIKGDYVIPQPNLLRCLVDGGTYHKIGKAQVTTASKSILYGGALDILAAEIPIIHGQPWTVDTRAVVIPSTKGRILAHRPRFDDWALDFNILIDPKIVGERLMRAIIDDAGNRVGLGDFRPARKGPYGRFRVDRWGPVSAAAPAAIAA